MRIVVLVKHVPDPDAGWSFAPDLTLDRSKVEGRLSELDEYAVEQAVRLVEGGLDAEVVALTMGPADAVDGLRKALAMGADAGVHVEDDAIHGSDALASSLVLAEAIKQTGFDLVLTGMSSTDAEMSVVPSMVADRLGVNQATFAGEISVADGVVSIRRESEAGSEHVSAALPAVVSVTDQSGEARYPAFKAIMASKKKPVQTYSLADLGIASSDVGLEAATRPHVAAVSRVTARPMGFPLATADPEEQVAALYPAYPFDEHPTIVDTATLPAAVCEIAPVDLYNVLYALRTRRAKKSPRGASKLRSPRLSAPPAPSHPRSTSPGASRAR